VEVTKWPSSRLFPNNKNHSNFFSVLLWDELLIWLVVAFLQLSRVVISIWKQIWAPDLVEFLITELDPLILGEIFMRGLSPYCWELYFNLWVQSFMCWAHFFCDWAIVLCGRLIWSFLACFNYCGLLSLRGGETKTLDWSLEGSTSFLGYFLIDWETFWLWEVVLALYGLIYLIAGSSLWLQSLSWVVREMKILVRSHISPMLCHFLTCIGRIDWKREKYLQKMGVLSLGDSLHCWVVFLHLKAEFEKYRGRLV
jgi:hypothetical protein